MDVSHPFSTQSFELMYAHAPQDPSPSIMHRGLPHRPTLRTINDCWVEPAFAPILNRRGTLWFVIDNSMIIPLAHAGRPRCGACTSHAHAHRHVWRARLICQGHTANTSNTLTQLQEAQVHRVLSNHLYNNIISKLFKARKGYYALELFELMKPGGVVKSSSIPYCVVIGACVRVGDIHSAETLFAETYTGYRPRVPMLNTVM
ncbi:hypothetical protein B0H11DRAFT_898909 [Mycena galericulata]|nr:hypothetical protein B0H11DRAFT_898909 [Mycena galericulata]